MLEHGVSLARVRYAFNSTNVEGWGLYSESIYQTLHATGGPISFAGLQVAARGPGISRPGTAGWEDQPADAYRVLEQDVVQSHAFAEEEVERYTYRSPGQANSYFYGYTKLLHCGRKPEQRWGLSLTRRNSTTSSWPRACCHQI